MKVILVNGRAGSGKTTFATLLQSELQSKGYKVSIIGNADTVRDYAKKYFKLNDYRTENGRRIMIGITEMFYDQDNYYFEHETWKKACENDCDYLIVHDWRYENTYNYFKIKKCDVVGVRLLRRGIRYTSEIEKDRSENLNTLKDCIDYTIDNMDMSIKDLTEEIEQFVRTIL